MDTEVVGYNKETLLEMLHSRVVIVKFKKANGDLRNMRCTLKADLLPGKETSEETETKKVPKPNVVTVWDLEAEDWRSFRTDRVEEVI